jgi:hypothetical protein
MGGAQVAACMGVAASSLEFLYLKQRWSVWDVVFSYETIETWGDCSSHLEVEAVSSGGWQWQPLFSDLGRWCAVSLLHL